MQSKVEPMITRFVMAAMAAALLGCGSAFAQFGGAGVTPAPSPLGMTSPLGIGPAAPVPPTGLRLGTTELPNAWREPADIRCIAGTANNAKPHVVWRHRRFDPAGVFRRSEHRHGDHVRHGNIQRGNVELDLAVRRRQHRRNRIRGLCRGRRQLFGGTRRIGLVARRDGIQVHRRPDRNSAGRHRARSRRHQSPAGHSDPEPIRTAVNAGDNDEPLPDDRNVSDGRNSFELLLSGTFETRRTQVRRKFVISAGLLVAVLAIGGALAVTHTFSFERPAPAPAATAPAPIVAGMVAQHDVPIYLTGVGTVIAYNTVVVRSQIQGQIVNINFTEGQTVHTGDLLAQIDPRPYQAQLDQVDRHARSRSGPARERRGQFQSLQPTGGQRLGHSAIGRHAEGASGAAAKAPSRRTRRSSKPRRFNSATRA